MSTVTEIQRAILGLREEDFRQLAQWLEERAADRWDSQIKHDANEGRLDALIREADEAIDQGRVVRLP